MKLLLYYIALLILIVLVTGFLLSTGSGQGMSMNQVITVCSFLILYTVGMSFVGEMKAEDERDLAHKFTASRAGIIAGTIILSIGILVQLFTHHLDYWLLAGLIGINVTKIVSLIYLNYRK